MQGVVRWQQVQQRHGEQYGEYQQADGHGRLRAKLGAGTG
jgi:hypothetical protein